MAGIGFELKRLFRRKGLFATMRAYGYAGIVCTGPMLLGVLLQVGMLVLCGLWGVGRANQDLLVCMVTYTLLASLTLTSFFSMPVTRFLADMLFAEREDEILPSFWGSNAIMLVAGTVLYGVFLLFSGATLLQGLLCLWLFNIMIVNWNGMSYLTAIKDYRGILCSFAAAIGVACLCALAALALGLPPVEGLLASIALGYGVMLAWDVVLLYRYFPQSDRSPLALFAVARSVYAAGAHGSVNQSGTLCAPGDYLGRSHWRAGQGLVLWCALLRCAGAHCVFDDPGHDRQLCGLGRGQLLSALPRLLQPVQ